MAGSKNAERVDAMSALSPILRAVEGNRLSFWCPGCNEAHTIVHGGGGWKWNGNAEQPTFEPSVLVKYYRASPEGLAMMERMEPLPPGMERYPGKHMVCHSFVRDGRIQFLGDCTHQLAGQTVPLPAWTNEAQAGSAD